MKHERLTEEVQELAALYALGALTQHEARSFEIHLRDFARNLKRQIDFISLDDPG